MTSGGWSAVASSQKKALSRYRRALKRRGIARLEVRVRTADVPLVRKVVDALADPARARDARSLLREHFGERKRVGLKALLASAPLEGVQLRRARDPGGKVEL
jgi:hypothetical protein